MPSSARQLHDLQELDLQLDALKQDLNTVVRQLRDDLGVGEAQAQVQQLQQHLKHLRVTQHEVEIEAQGSEAKIKSVQQKLYGGSIRNPRELKGLEDDLNYLQRSHSQIEDRALEVMAQVEDMEAQLHQAQQTLAQRQQALEEQQARLKEEHARLSAQIQALEAQRQQHAATISDADLDLYQRLRDSKGGRAVARLERDTCLGCRITLPTAEAQRVRIPTTLVRCKSCGRILVQL